MTIKKKRIVWGSLGSLREFPGGDHGGESLHVRKPHETELDLTFGSRMKTKEIDDLRTLALKAGTPEARLDDGFHEDVFACTISDESQDRYGDKIQVDGWDIVEYRKNPVLLFGHDYESIAVGHGLDIYSDKQNPGTDDERARLRGIFMWSRSNPVARVLKGVYADGDMRAFSVGFIPKEFHVPDSDEERDALGLGEWGVLHQKQTLLENSAVPVPANPNAITEESVKAFRDGGAIREEDVPGLRKLSERLVEVNLELSKSIGLFLPTTKTMFEVRHALKSMRAQMAPAGDVEDVKPEGEDTQVTDAHTADAPKSKVIPEDISRELAPVDMPWTPLTEEDFPQFDTLGDDERELVSRFFAHAEAIPPSAFAQLSLGHHNAEDGTVNVMGVLEAIDAINTGADAAALVPVEEREDAFNHLALHLQDAGIDVPAFEANNAEPAEGTKGGHGDGTAEGAEPKKEGPDEDEEDPDLVTASAPDAKTRKSTERKWRVVRAHRPEKAPEDTVYSRNDWDKAVGEDFSLRRNTSLMYDENDQKNPRAYLMPHHLAEEGTPVVWANVKRAMTMLFSKSVEGKVQEGARRRGYFHLRTHYGQFDKEAPSFRSMDQLVQLSSFLREMVDGLTNGDQDTSMNAELTLDLVFAGFMNASDKAYEIQALTFDMTRWEAEDAKSWATNHGFNVNDVSDIEGRYVFTQTSLSRFVKVEEKGVEGDDGDGVALRTGRLKNPVHLLSEEIAGLREDVAKGFTDARTLTLGNGSPKAAALIASLMETKTDDNFGTILEGSTRKLEEANAVLSRSLNQDKE